MLRRVTAHGMTKRGKRKKKNKEGRTTGRKQGEMEEQIKERRKKEGGNSTIFFLYLVRRVMKGKRFKAESKGNTGSLDRNKKQEARWNAGGVLRFFSAPSICFIQEEGRRRKMEERKIMRKQTRRRRRFS